MEATPVPSPATVRARARVMVPPLASTSREVSEEPVAAVFRVTVPPVPRELAAVATTAPETMVVPPV